MDQGGLAAMLPDLLHMDLGDFHPRAVPATTELTEQKLHSLDTLQRWWLTVLDRGFVWRSRYGHKDFLRWDEFVSTELLNNSYRQWCSDNRVNYPEHREALGSFMEKFYPHRRPRGAHPISSEWSFCSVSSVVAGTARGWKSPRSMCSRSWSMAARPPWSICWSNSRK